MFLKETQWNSDRYLRSDAGFAMSIGHPALSWIWTVFAHLPYFRLRKEVKSTGHKKLRNK